MSPLLGFLTILGLAAGQQPTNYCAQIVAGEANRAVGYFAMQIYAGQASYSFSLDLSNFQIKTCNVSAGLMYHIHTSWNNATKNSASGPTYCGAAIAGGHYDPNLACGYASTSCTALSRSIASYNCSSSTNAAGQYSQCQVGDLSGKFGNAVQSTGTIFKQLTPLIDYQPPYAANFLTGSARSTMFSSVVFHCSDNSRLVCAKFQIVPSGQASICPFPATSASTIATLTADNNYNKGVVMKAEIAVIILAIIIFCLFVAVIILFCWRKKAPYGEATESIIEAK